MQKVRLEHLSRHGEEDPGTNYNFEIDKSKYFELKKFPIIDLNGRKIFKTTFHEIYRNHKRVEDSCHQAIVIEQKYVNKVIYIVWLEKEKVWVVFEYEDKKMQEDSFFETSYPWRSNVYRVSKQIAQIISNIYNMSVELDNVFEAEPNN